MLDAMNPRTRTLTAALSGAVVLASGAYAVGSQSGDGNASADTARVTQVYGPPGPGGPRGVRVPDLAAAAKKLGVSESELRAALQDLRPPRDHRGPGDLAKALGVSQSKLQKAFKDIAERERKAFASQLAKELGVSTETVTKAFEKERSVHTARRDDAAAKLAKKLGVSKSKVQSVLGGPGGPGAPGPKFRFHREGGGPGFGGPPGLDQGPGGPPASAPAPPPPGY
jgi:transcriptional regulator with XRE-family HTH domain